MLDQVGQQHFFSRDIPNHAVQRILLLVSRALRVAHCRPCTLKNRTTIDPSRGYRI